jgi:hypothetical protein
MIEEIHFKLYNEIKVKYLLFLNNYINTEKKFQ